MNTKERILNEALTLFSQKGYSAVYLSEIAKAVNIKPPSLYKHYKSKNDIFESCINVFSKRIEQIRDDLQLPNSNVPLISYEQISEQHLINIAFALFTFYLKDDVASKFRKMLMIERYHNPELNKIFENIFIKKAVEYEEEIFSNLINKKIIKKTDPHIIALQFYTPIFYLLQKYDMRQNEIEKAKQELSLIIHEFTKNYNLKKGEM